MKHISIFSLVFIMSMMVSSSAFAVGVDTNVSGTVRFGVKPVASTSVDVQSSTSVEVHTGAHATTSAGSVSENETGTDTSVDSETSTVTSTDNSVSVSYNVPAKFLGFLSVNMTEKATVQVVEGGKTTVTVNRPWWVIFAKVNSKSADVSSRIKARIPTVSASAATKIDASTKAQFVSAIEAAAQADVSGNAEVK